MKAECLQTVAISFALCVVISAQHREEAVAVSVLPGVRAPTYFPVDARVYRVYGVRPIKLSVSITNATDREVEIRGVVDWAEAVNISFGRDEPGVPVHSIRGATRGAAATATQRIRLKPQAAASAVFRLQGAVNDALEEGRYRVSVSLDEQALGGAPQSRNVRNMLSREVVIEFKRPENNLELVEYYLQLSAEARSEQLETEVRRWSEMALGVKPDSVAALSELGGSYLREKRCDLAKPVLERSIDILCSGGDVELRRSQPARLDLIDSMKSRLVASCGVK